MKKAIEKYKEFWKMEPKKTGSFPPSFKIPLEAVCVGDAVNVMYRSGKLDPNTLEKPKRPIDYIHEHGAGVKLYRCDSEADGAVRRVPRFITGASELVLLGQNLGFCYRDQDGNEIEAEPRTPYPELYTIPSGKALLVVQDKRKVIALIWGGKLDVQGRGIVH